MKILRFWLMILTKIHFGAIIRIFVVIQRHHKIPTFLFSRSVSFKFSLIIIQKQQKHANCITLTKNIFMNKP